MPQYSGNDISALFAAADEYRRRISAARPLAPAEAKGLRDYFQIGATYSSNALEGNTLTLTETKVLLEDGLTAGGKPLRDSYEAIGHAKAYAFMLEAAQTNPLVITEELIRKLHFLFYQNIDPAKAGEYRTIQNFITGTEYLPPAPRDVPGKMKTFIDAVNREKLTVHTIEFATLLHKGLVDIHPFEDGNGRTARLLMNLALVSAGYGVAIIPPVLRMQYIDALKASQRENEPDNTPLLALIAECVIETQKDYCRLLGI